MSSDKKNTIDTMLAGVRRAEAHVRYAAGDPGAPKPAGDEPWTLTVALQALADARARLRRYEARR